MVWLFSSSYFWLKFSTWSWPKCPLKAMLQFESLPFYLECLKLRISKLHDNRINFILYNWNSCAKSRYYLLLLCPHGWFDRLVSRAFVGDMRLTIRVWALHKGNFESSNQVFGRITNRIDPEVSGSRRTIKVGPVNRKIKKLKIPVLGFETCFLARSILLF